MRAVPHRSRHTGAGQDRAGPHAHREPRQDCGGHAAEHERASRRLGSRRAADQARQPDAAQCARRRRSAGAARVPGEPEMKRDAGRPDHERRELPPVLEDVSQLERTWADQPGIVGWITSVDHKSIGKRYIVTSFVWFLLAGLLAAAMRLQLSRPDNSFLGPDLYNQIFTMHGTVMMFLFAVPMVQGLGVYLVPLMVGARAIAFPRLVAWSYWMFLFGGMFIFTAFAMNTA